jgi:hypothetical protein
MKPSFLNDLGVVVLVTSVTFAPVLVLGLVASAFG